MSTHSLPPHPSLRHLKHQAQDLLRAHRAGGADALSRVSAQSSRPQAAAAITLADAQRVIAREYGFASWPKMKRHVESIGGAEPTAGDTPVDLEPFKAAVQSGDAAEVRRILRELTAVRAKINAPVFEMDAPAIVFARGNRAMIEALLDFGADVNARGQFWGRSIGVLDEASSDTAAFLIGRGALPELGAFAEAIAKGDVPTVREMLEQNPSLRQHVDRPMYSFGGRPVGAAKKNLPMLDLLLEYGADINLKSEWWAGGFGVLDGVDAATAETLVARGAVVDVHAAAHLGKLDRVQELVAKDRSLVNAKGGDGKRPLHDASTLEVIDFLLDHGADIDARCVDHLSTPAQYAVRQPWKCKHLLDRGATPDIFMAAALGDVELARELLEADPACVGAHVGLPGYAPVPVGAGGSIYQWELPAKTAHEVAAAFGHRGVYDLLMWYTPEAHRFALACVTGDQAAVRAALGKNPERMRELVAQHPRALADAAWRHDLNAVRVMLDAGFPVDETGGGDGTPLDRAAIRGAADIVKLLLSRGASVATRNVYGGDPLGACQWGSLNLRDRKGDYPAAAEALIAAGAPVPDKVGGSEAVAAVLRRHGGLA